MSIVHQNGLTGPDVYVCAQGGCRICQERLMHQHEALVHIILQRQFRGKAAYKDLLQEGRIGLWKAVLRPVLSVQDSVLILIAASPFSHMQV